MYKCCLFFLLLCVITGCVRARLDPCLDFACVQQEAYARSGECIEWNAEAEIACLLEGELSVEAVVRVALLNNRKLQAIYQELGIAKAQLVQAGLLTNPIFGMSYRFSTNPSITDLIDMGIFHNVLETLLIPLKKRLARAELEATKARILALVLEVIAQTKIAFYELQAHQQLLDHKQALLLGADAAADAALRLAEAGNLIELELAEKKVLLREAAIELASEELEVQIIKERLNVLMGLCGECICWRAERCLSPLPDELRGWECIELLAVEKNLELDQARQTIYASSAGLSAAIVRQIFPQLEIGPDSERDESVWFVGPALAMAIPIFDFGQAKRAGARAEIFRQYQLYLDLSIEVQAKARVASAHLLNAFEQSQLYSEQIVPLAERVLDHSIRQYNAMQLGVFGLLEQKQEQLRRNMEWVEHQLDFWRALTEIETLCAGHMMEGLCI
ncbi:MAG: hypothetical protein S4CHLAM123_09970 [Chlamydiales bacterium]|nr:hypothetical protein [Chlamydiales bacterium]